MTIKETRDAVIKEHGTAAIPLATIAQRYFGLSPRKASAAAAACKLPVAAYQTGSRKSPWLVSADALARLIEDRKKAAADEWSKVNGRAA